MPNDHRSTLLIPLGTRNLECLAGLVWRGAPLRATVPAGTLAGVPIGKGGYGAAGKPGRSS